MPTVADIRPIDALQLLIIGKSGLGKTEGAATWPRPIFFDFDNGMRTVASHEFKSRHPEIDISKIRFETFRERSFGANGILTGHNAFDDACRFFDECVKPGVIETFDTFVVDSLTTLGAFAMNKAIVLTGDPNVVSKRNLTETFSIAKSKGLISPEGSDYTSAQSLVLQFIDMLRQTKKNVIFLAHSTTHMNKDGSAPTGYEIMATGQTRETIPIRFDEVYFLDIMPDGATADGKPKYKRFLITHMDSMRKAKTRLGLPDGTAWTYAAIQAAVASLTPKA